MMPLDAQQMKIRHGIPSVGRAQSHSVFPSVGHAQSQMKIRHGIPSVGHAKAHSVDRFQSQLLHPDRQPLHQFTHLSF